MKQALLVLGVAALFSMPLVYANDAPVVDVTQQAEPQSGNDSAQTPLVNTVSPSNAPDQPVSPSVDSSSVTQLPPISTSNLSTAKRLARLEQQVRNLTKMNLPAQISELQQQVAKLKGQVQVQAHEIETLKAAKSAEPAKSQTQTKAQTPATSSGPISDVASDDPTKVPPPPVKKASDESSTYRNAFDLLIKKQYAPAAEGFENYLKQYPKGQFLVNAHYWLGEIYLMQKKSPMALEQFQVVVNDFPNSSKVADAKLKVAQILAQTGKMLEARKILVGIIKKYPGSTAAQLAKIQLQQLKPPTRHRED